MHATFVAPPVFYKHFFTVCLDDFVTGVETTSLHNRFNIAHNVLQLPIEIPNDMGCKMHHTHTKRAAKICYTLRSYNRQHLLWCNLRFSNYLSKPSDQRYFDLRIKWAIWSGTYALAWLNRWHSADYVNAMQLVCDAMLRCCRCIRSMRPKWVWLPMSPRFGMSRVIRWFSVVVWTRSGEVGWLTEVILSTKQQKRILK